MKKPVILGVALGALGALGLSVAAWIGQRGDDDPTARVLREDFAVVVEAPGKLEAAVAYDIGPPSVRDVFSYNLSWMIPEGKVVAEGDVVARFDATEMEEQLRDHRAALEKVGQEKEKEQRNLDVSLRQMRLDLVKAQGELRTLEIDLEVPEELLSSIEIGQLRLRQRLAGQRVEFLTKKIDFEKELVKTKLDLLDVKRAYEESKVAYYDDAQRKFTIRAPIPGLIVYIPKRNGGRWEVGESVWMLAKILQVADTATLRVEASVLEVDASRIAPGQTAEIAVDAVPGLTLASAVAQVGRIVRERSHQDRTKVFDVFLPMDGVDNELIRPGMGVQVRILAQTLPGSLTVPLEAIRASRDGTWVEVIGAGGVERRPVTLGPRNSGRVVVESGVEEGDRVRRFEELS